jgi:hypothetical protein
MRPQIGGGSREGEYVFFDSMHGSTVKGASNVEPQLRKDSDIAAMLKLGFAGESSFIASKNTYSPSPVVYFIGFLPYACWWVSASIFKWYNFIGSPKDGWARNII